MAGLDPAKRWCFVERLHMMAVCGIFSLFRVYAQPTDARLLESDTSYISEVDMILYGQVYSKPHAQT